MGKKFPKCLKIETAMEADGSSYPTTV